MIKRATLEEVLDIIDAIHVVNNLKNLSDNAVSETTRHSASRTLLEIAQVLKSDPKKTQLEGNNVKLVIED